MINFPSALLWGFIATLALTGIGAVSQRMGWTRMSVPFLVGTAFTSSWDRAMLYGAGVHMLNGLAFAFLYAWVFQSVGAATWWAGTLLGALHAFTVLTLGMKLLPSVHPRMANEYFGPTAHRMIEPPGFFALHYGRSTPLITLLAHLAYGAVLGGFYRLAGS